MVVGIAWNAGAFRGRLLGLRRLGGGGCRELARAESLDDALASLVGGPYGHDLERDMTLPSAEWAVASTPLWHLRVLAGWLPPAGAELVRVLAGWWEILNIENLMAGLAGAATLPAYDLGRLETAWRRLRVASSLEALRERLAASAWLDPGGEDAATIVTWLRLHWAQRVSDEAEAASRLAAGWAALTAARHRLLGDADVTASMTRHVPILGRRWTDAGSLAELRDRLPADAAWVLEDIDDPDDMWHGEVRWWRTLDETGKRLLRRPESGPEAVLGAFGALLADAHRVQGALELATRPGFDEHIVDEAL